MVEFARVGGGHACRGGAGVHAPVDVPEIFISGSRAMFSHGQEHSMQHACTSFFVWIYDLQGVIGQAKFIKVARVLSFDWNISAACWPVGYEIAFVGRIHARAT